MQSSLQTSPSVASETSAWPTSLERYKSIVQNAVEGIFQSTPDGRYLLVNRALVRMYGYESAEELVGVRDISQTIYTDPKVREEFQRLMERDDEVRGLEYEVRRKDGSTLWISEHARAVRSESGEVLYYEGFVQDIGERKQTEADLRNAKEAAEAASLAKSQFLAVMSHEIRTPMNGVIGMTSLLLNSTLTAEQREFAEIIRLSGDSLLTIINDILDFSKIESGKLELEHEPFDLRHCMESVLDVLAPRAAEKGLDLLCEGPDQTATMFRGDESRLRQVLINLVGNAVKFTERGECVLSVRTEPQGSGTRLHFTVRDTGIGISPDTQERIFQSFSQADASTTRRFGGTGLGLAISKRLAALMGGDITVESTLGSGSTFHFHLLLHPEERSSPSLAPWAPVLAGRRLLVVDDNATNRRILTSLAASWGMSSETASSGPEALALLQRGATFDVAILDMQMPEMDGTMLARKIRQLRTPKELPLVLLTSLGQVERSGTNEVFAACHSKPAKPAQIRETLRRLCSNSEYIAADKVPSPVTTAQPASAERILVAEDNAVNQKVAQHMLARLGYPSDVATSGHEALTALQACNYTVILMDVQMPGMDGLEAARRIRERPADDHRPWIIALTANALPGDRERCLEAGMDDYLTKPLKLRELASALDACLQARGTDVASPTLLS